MKQAKQYARKLWEARNSGTYCALFADDLTIDQAYEIQSQCTNAAPEAQEVIGYKVGATSTASLELLGLDEPFYGPLYKSAFAHNNGNTDVLSLPLLTQHKSRVEAEFVVCIKNDIERGSSDITIDELSEHIDWIAPGFEMVATRFDKPLTKLGAMVIADFGGNQHMVVGEPFYDWKSLDLDNHPVTLAIDDEPVIEGHSGLSIYGNPLAFVCWLLNHPTRYNEGLKAGQIVSCGTVSGAPFIHKGSHITADYGVLGKLAVKIV